MGDVVAKAQAVRGARLVVGREPTPDELAEQLGWDPEKVEEALSVTEEPTSLHRPLGPAHEDRGELGHLLVDPAPDGAPDERAVGNMESARLRKTLE